MRSFLLALLFPLALSSCASGLGLVGDNFASQTEFAAAIERRWSLADLDSFCSPERISPKDVYVQPPIMFLAPHWHGEIVVGREPHSYVIVWDAIAIRGKVEAYRVWARRGQDSWHLEYHANPKFPFLPEEIRRLMKESEKEPIQLPERTRGK